MQANRKANELEAELKGQTEGSTVKVQGQERIVQVPGPERIVYTERMQANRKVDELEPELTGASFNIFYYISLCPRDWAVKQVVFLLASFVLRRQNVSQFCSPYVCVCVCARASECARAFTQTLRNNQQRMNIHNY